MSAEIRRLSLALALGLFGTSAAAMDSQSGLHQPMPKYSALAGITAANVKNLQPAWTYHTGEVIDPRVGQAFEDAPSVIEGNLIVCTPTHRIIALDPTTGQERWIYDPKDDGARSLNKCRGVSWWTDDQAAANAVCRTRMFVGTSDYRLVAIDAKTGKACTDFGTNGNVQMVANKPELFQHEVNAGSTAVVNGVVVVGSVISDNQRLNAPSGRVQAFDARTGQPKWTFDPIPRDPSDPAMATWLKGSGEIGGSNVWGPISADDALDLVYLPTTAPSGDYYGGSRPGANLYANSLVAIKGATGEVAWSFQFVHHDLWDYDTPSSPLLIDLPLNGEIVPAAAQNTKMGMIFVFNRKTGEPLFPIEERPVPQDGAVPGEWLSKTQPFPTAMPNLTPQRVTPDDAWGFTPIDRWLCRRKIAALTHGPIYTPPTVKGTIYMPPSAGGVNWGGAAYDPASHLMIVPSNLVATILTLLPRGSVDTSGPNFRGATEAMIFPSEGAPYATSFAPLLSPLGAPCTAPPWATLSAIDMTTGKLQWQVPLGTIEKVAPVPIPWELGAPGAGSPLVTAGGIVFIGYTSDQKFRAIDIHTGKTLWTASLPAAAMSTPATYEANGEQYVVVPAGGHIMYGTTKGDAVIAFKLKH